MKPGRQELLHGFRQSRPPSARRPSPRAQRTPVENHLGELWSLFEFLNPGMLGEARVLNMAGGLARNPGEDARRILAQALRPFILRPHETAGGARIAREDRADHLLRTRRPAAKAV